MLITLTAPTLRAPVSDVPPSGRHSAEIIVFPKRFRPGLDDAGPDNLCRHIPSQEVDPAGHPLPHVPDLLHRVTLPQRAAAMWRHAVAAAGLLVFFVTFAASIIWQNPFALPGQPASEDDFLVVELVTVAPEQPASVSTMPSPPPAQEAEAKSYTPPEPQPEPSPVDPPAPVLDSEPPAAPQPLPPPLAQIEPLPPAKPNEAPALALPPQPAPEMKQPDAMPAVVEQQITPNPPPVVEQQIAPNPPPKAAKPAKDSRPRPSKRVTAKPKVRTAQAPSKASGARSASQRKGRASAAGNGGRSPQAIQRYISQVRQAVRRRMPRAGVSGSYSVSLTIGAGGRLISLSVSGAGKAKARVSAALRGSFPPPPAGVPVPFRVTVPVSVVGRG